MDKERLFHHLQQQENAVLLRLLDDAYESMHTTQHRAIFSHLGAQVAPAVIDGAQLLERVQAFNQASRASAYYAPFNVNSKNFMAIPEETEAWFEQLGAFLKESSRLTEQGEHEQAVACFQVLYQLIDVMESGENIVFADELGGWMIPGEEKQYITAYLTALAAIATPESFVDHALPLVKRDRYSSLIHQVYATARKLGNPTQKNALQAEVKRRNSRTQRQA